MEERGRGIRGNEAKTCFEKGEAMLGDAVNEEGRIH